jgi:hypothetical protein
MNVLTAIASAHMKTSAHLTPALWHKPSCAPAVQRLSSKEFLSMEGLPTNLHYTLRSTLDFNKKRIKMNLRLFAIRDLTTKRILPDLYFSSKQAAKTKRDELGATSHCVTWGPDHRKFSS